MSQTGKDSHGFRGGKIRTVKKFKIELSEEETAEEIRDAILGQSEELMEETDEDILNKLEK